MRLTEVEKKQWTKKHNERSNQGRAFLSDLIGTDPNYKGWSIYWGYATKD